MNMPSTLCRRETSVLLRGAGSVHDSGGRTYDFPTRLPSGTVDSSDSLLSETVTDRIRTHPDRPTGSTQSRRKGPRRAR